MKVSRFEPGERSIKVLEIMVPYNLFLQQNLVDISAALSSRPYFRKAPKKLKAKAVKKGNTNAPKKVNSTKKMERNIFSVCPKTHTVSLRCKKVEPIPDVFAIAGLVQLLAVIFGSGAIQSNLIESLNSQVKQVICTRGLKTEAQLQHRLTFFFHAHSGFDPPEAKRTYDLRSRHALKSWSVI